MGCNWVYDDSGAQSGLQIKAEYNQEWMIRHNDCPWSQATLDSVASLYPEVLPQLPAGLRTVIYRPADSQLLFNLPAEGGRINIDPGDYGILLYNNDLRSIAVVTGENLDAAVAEVPDGELNEALWVNVIPEMPVECKIHDVTALMKPMTWSYLLDLQVDSGFNEIKEAYCTLSGMASEVNLISTQRYGDTITGRAPCQLQPNALIGIARSLGTAEHADNHIVTLKVRLHNLKVITYAYDCTAQVSVQPQGGLIRIKNIKINPSDAHDDNVGGEGFDVNVKTWGPEIEIPVPW